MKKKLRWIIPVSLILVLVCAFLIYTGIYYHADETAVAALESDGSVFVTRTEYGWMFDGPSDENVLVFYPGAKVEETAYAPLAHRLAGEGMDVCLVEMPFRLAFFASGKAQDVLAQYDYPNRYIGGHSLGGAMAANYAADHGETLSGVILLAAYPTKELDDDLLLLSIRGSEDGVLNLEKVEAGRRFSPRRTEELVIEGGNHAQFGNYGIQSGDGDASITWEEQQKAAADFILQAVQ